MVWWRGIPIRHTGRNVGHIDRRIARLRVQSVALLRTIARGKTARIAIGRDLAALAILV